MLSRNDFFDTVKRNIINFLPEEMYDKVEITDTVVTKMNDQKLHGIVIKEHGKEAAPTFYMDDMFDRYESGEDLGSLMSEMARIYSATMDAPRPPQIDLNFDAVRDNLSVRLMEVSRNRDFLRDMPYVDLGNGLAMTADLNFPGGMDGDWRVAVNHGVMEQLGVDRHELFTTAMDSAVINDRAMLTDMTQALFGPGKENLLDRSCPIDPADIGGMYVLTTESGTLGASALYYPDVKEKAAEVIGCSYYVLPSSTHEVILVPDAAGIDEKELCSMVKQANRTVVEPKDVLSDNVYHFDKDTRELSKVSDDRERDSIVAEAR